MPYADEYVALCLVLARYDLRTSLAVILERHRSADRDTLPFRPHNHQDFADLLSGLPGKHDWTMRRPPASPLELAGTTIGSAAKEMLGFDFARAGDTDIGWYRLPGKPVRPEQAALRALLAAAESPDAEIVRQALVRIYHRELPS
jgi:hypothetical protein